MSKTIKFLPHMCKKQKEELKAILHAADDIGAAAVSVASNNGQGYNLLLEARDRFRDVLMSAASHYRWFIEEEETNCSAFDSDYMSSYSPSIDTICINDTITLS